MRHEGTKRRRGPKDYDQLILFFVRSSFLLAFVAHFGPTNFTRRGNCKCSRRMNCTARTATAYTNQPASASDRSDSAARLDCGSSSIHLRQLSWQGAAQ